ncbi:beta-2 adrenergic receptor-like [Oculina patagonica]
MHLLISVTQLFLKQDFTSFFCRTAKPTIMNISCLNERLSSAASIILSMWFSLSGLAAVIGNAIVLWLFYKNESLRTMSNRFLASLSVADFSVGLVIDPTWIAIRCLIQPPENWHTLNKVMDMLWIHTTAATVFNVCCVSVDRFIAIRFPFRYQDIITKKRCYTVIIMVWLISLFFPLLVLFEDVQNLWLILSVLTFVIPIAIVTFCYVWIFKAARKQATTIRQENQPADSPNQPTHAKENYKAIKTIGFVLGIFIVSWMPCLVVSVVHEFAAYDECVNHKLYSVVWPWIEAIAFTSSAINPWIYYLRNSAFREAFRRRFCWFPSTVKPEHTPEQASNQELQIAGFSLAENHVDEVDVSAKTGVQ